MARVWLAMVPILGAACTTLGDSEKRSLEELTWRDDASGRVYLAEPIEPIFWDEAIQICSELSIGDSDGWRLPAQIELEPLAGSTHPHADELGPVPLWPADTTYYQVKASDTTGGALCVQDDPQAVGAEHCLNGADDDGDGQTDCADDDCRSEEICDADTACAPTTDASGRLAADPLTCRCASDDGCPFEDSSSSLRRTLVCHTSFGVCARDCTIDLDCTKLFGEGTFCDDADRCRRR